MLNRPADWKVLYFVLISLATSATSLLTSSMHPSLLPGHFHTTSSWHLLWTTTVQTEKENEKRSENREIQPCRWRVDGLISQTICIGLPMFIKSSHIRRPLDSKRDGGRRLLIFIVPITGQIEVQLHSSEPKRLLWKLRPRVNPPFFVLWAGIKLSFKELRPTFFRV